MNRGYGQIDIYIYSTQKSNFQPDDWFKVVAGWVYEKPTLKYCSRDLVWSRYKKKSLILKVFVKSKF